MSRFNRYLLMLATLVLVACAPMPSASTATTILPTDEATTQPTIAPSITPLPTATPFSSGRVSVGEHKLYLECVGDGTPTVIIEDGAGGGGDKWMFIMRKVKAVTRICRYDRANNGDSDRASGPRTGQDVVADLHALLGNAVIEPPFILVGFSVGGLFARLYADQYPDEVVGMVLVDSNHPDQWNRWLAALPEPSPDEVQSITEFRDLIHSLGDWENTPERIDDIALDEEVRQVASLGDLPLIVLTRDPKAAPGSFRPEFQDEMEQIWQELQVDLAQLSTNSTHIVVAGAPHGIPLIRPQAVIEAINTLIGFARVE